MLGCFLDGSCLLLAVSVGNFNAMMSMYSGSWKCSGRFWICGGHEMCEAKTDREISVPECVQTVLNNFSLPDIALSNVLSGIR